MDWIQGNKYGINRTLVYVVIVQVYKIKVLMYFYMSIIAEYTDYFTVTIRLAYNLNTISTAGLHYVSSRSGSRSSTHVELVTGD